MLQYLCGGHVGVYTVNCKVHGQVLEGKDVLTLSRGEKNTQLTF